MIKFVNFIRKKYSEFSEYSGRKGTVIDELIVRPVGKIMSNFYNLQVEHQNRNNIEQWENMTDDQLDFFGNKFFLPRAQGTKAFGSIRIYTQYKENITITNNSRAVSETGLLYVFKNPGIISKNLFKESDNLGYSRYYIELMIEAEYQGNNYNQDPGGITSLRNVDFDFISVNNPEKIFNGNLRETNENYFNRLKYGINDRSMMNKRSVYALLPQSYPTIKSMYISSSRDKYMNRDLVQAVDLSEPKKEANYLGKIQNDNTIKNTAYYGIFPPEAGSRGAEYNGPFSIRSDYKKPLTVEAVDLLDEDPAFHGYPLYQEATSDMYRGLYFNDLVNFMDVETSPLFDIENEDVGFNPVITPNEDWIIGSNQQSNGNYGKLEDGLSKIDVISFENNDIFLRGGTSNSITVSKDINKRTGIKLTGSFITPELSNNISASNSSLQFMVGGVNEIDIETGSPKVDSYTGIGFGVRFFEEIDDTTPAKNNAAIYFAHSEKYANTQIYANTVDYHSSIGDVNALAEYAARLRSGEEYEFEFVIYDNLVLSLVINKVAAEDTNDDSFTNKMLPQTVLNAFKDEINSSNTDNYGTMMKVTLDTESKDNEAEWQVSNLRAVDLAEHRANALFIFDVKDLEKPLSISFRGTGSGSINGALSEGYFIYIWDTEKEPVREGGSLLSNGGWTELKEVSNPNGEIDTISRSVRQVLNNIDRYIVDTKYGSNVILLATSTGASEVKLLANNEINEDIQSSLNIDYIDIKNSPIDTYHSDNKADIYVDTTRNNENLEIVDTTITKSAYESLFYLNENNGFHTPISEILGVAMGNSIAEDNMLSDDDYTIMREDFHKYNSSKENIILSVNGLNTITVRYTKYKDVARIQDQYDNQNSSKIYGNILIKHKIPTYLDIDMSFYGDGNVEDVIEITKNYFDNNIDTQFHVDDFINFMNQDNKISYIQRPLEIFYEKYDDDFNVVNGSFDDSLTIRDIDFFRIRNINVTKL